MSQTPNGKKNARMAMIGAAMALGMVGMSFLAVPLYRMFCQVTGYGGTINRANEGAKTVLDRVVTVRFDGTVDPALPWRFKPEQVSQTIHIGQSSLAFFKATNLSDKPVVARATYNVSPAKAGIYFKKIQCFCFTEQVLQPGETVDMPVTYFVDPSIADDPDLDDVTTITLAYTFYKWDEKDGEPVVSADTGKGGAGGGAE
ncbi:MAG: cytochrome c oxidase assembly protein [Alphaproteobacteria bacterium]|nr:cytochrome c oxidase assembly protein [Alphaproteobacteria bacterium]